MDTGNLDQIDAAIHLNRAYALREKGEAANALSACDAAINAARAFLAEAYNLRGIVLEELGWHGEAIEAYSLALETSPGFEEASDNLRELEAELGLSHSPVTVARFGSVGEAHVARGRLAAEGIWSFVADEIAATTIGPRGTGGIRLQVQESDAGKAREILGIKEEGGMRCPHCHSWDVRMPLLGNEWRCKDCDHRWTL